MDFSIATHKRTQDASKVDEAWRMAIQLACVLARIRKKRATDFMSHAVMLRGMGKPVCFAEL